MSRNPYIREVLRLSNGAYIGDTAEFRRVYPDAVKVTIQLPNWEEQRDGIKIRELHDSEEAPEGFFQEENPLFTTRHALHQGVDETASE